MHRHSRHIAFAGYASLLVGLYVGPVAMVACGLAFWLWRCGDPAYRQHGRSQVITLVITFLSLLMIRLLSDGELRSMLRAAVIAWAIWRPLHGAYCLHRQPR